MASISSLSAPGVEVREYDESIRIQSNTGTTIFVPGFAQQGPVEEIIQISSITDFENVYGIPTNAAERYFYYTVLALLENSGQGTTVLTSRLAYGSGEGDNVATAYTLHAYPAIPVVKDLTNKKGYTYFDFEGALPETTTTTRSKAKAEPTGIFKAFGLTGYPFQTLSLDNTITQPSEALMGYPVSVESEVILHGKYVNNIVSLNSIEANNIISAKTTSLEDADRPKFVVQVGAKEISCSADICVEADATKNKVTIEMAAPIYEGDITYGNMLFTIVYEGEDITTLFDKGSANDSLG